LEGKLLFTSVGYQNDKVLLIRKHKGEKLYKKTKPYYKRAEIDSNDDPGIRIWETTDSKEEEEEEYEEEYEEEEEDNKDDESRRKREKEIGNKKIVNLALEKHSERLKRKRKQKKSFNVINVLRNFVASIREMNMKNCVVTN
jgi:hypothetical protein